MCFFFLITIVRRQAGSLGIHVFAAVVGELSVIHVEHVVAFQYGIVVNACCMLAVAAI